MPRSFRCSVAPVGVSRSIGEPTCEVVVLRVVLRDERAVAAELRRASAALPSVHLTSITLLMSGSTPVTPIRVAERLALAGADAAHDLDARHAAQRVLRRDRRRREAVLAT